MSDAWLGFFGGVLTTLVGGLIASVVQRQNEAIKQKAEVRLDVYFRLLYLNQQYFWIAAAELRGEKAPTEVVVKCREISWKLADKLRTCDKVEQLDEILTILFSNSITSANERARQLDKLLESYGRLVDPSYARTIKRISEENVHLLGSGLKAKNTAPTAWNIGE